MQSIPTPDSNDICEWVEYCGGNASTFRAVYAGCNIYIPQSVSANHPLARTIGFEAAARLCDELAGDRFSVPMGPRSRAGAGRLLVLLLSWARLSANQIAAAGEMSARNVFRIRAELRSEGFLPPAINGGSSHYNERY